MQYLFDISEKKQRLREKFKKLEKYTINLNT